MPIHYLRTAQKDAVSGTALLRLDFNTEDDWRMRAVLPTIKFLLKNGCKIVIVSHKGRPEGVMLVNGVPKNVKKGLSLRPNAVHLTKLLGRRAIAGGSVRFVNHFRFTDIRHEVADAPARSVFLLDNLRFLPGEEKNDRALAKQLASLGTFYVNDAFAVCHRSNASVDAVTTFLPSYAGFELEQEIVSLGKAMVDPKHPLALILGGAKAADKLGVIKFFAKKADTILLGGGSANTVLALRGVDVKKSMRDKDPKSVAEIKRIVSATSTARKISVPVDFVWKDDAILDLGPKTAAAFAKKIAAARTIVWSGPLGLIEKKRYAKGTISIVKDIIGNRKAFRVAGGGETVMFLKKYGFDSRFDFVSTGGGAMIDYLAGQKLPGIEVLKRR
ncbi:MAG TPA: phosphoglycerate kinase [Candidatus Paceibacterota bacterium]|nr:phosphoglycerate kinase [Candidatus Paceibacterota bacterium]